MSRLVPFLTPYLRSGHGGPETALRCESTLASGWPRYSLMTTCTARPCGGLAVKSCFSIEARSSNPAAGVRIGDAGRRREEPEEARAKSLSEAELRRLLLAVEPEWLPLVELLAKTGLRISEASALTWDDLDRGARTLKVRRRRRGDDIDVPKSKYAKREIRLTRRSPVACGRRSPQAHRWRSRVLAGRRASEPHGGVPGRQVGSEAGRGRRPGRAAHAPAHLREHPLLAGLHGGPGATCLGHHSPAFTLSVTCTFSRTTCPDPTYLDDLTADEGVTTGSPRPTETGRDPAEVVSQETVAVARIP